MEANGFMNKIKSIVRIFFVELVTITSILVALLSLAMLSFIAGRSFSEAPALYLGGMVVFGGIWIFLVLVAHRKLK